MGSIITLAVTGRRERKMRTRAFLAFITQWRSEVSLFQQRDIGVGVVQGVYEPTLPQFHAEVARSRDAFSDQEIFDRLTGRLGSLGTEDWKDHSKTQKDIILGVMDELINFAT